QERGTRPDRRAVARDAKHRKLLRRRVTHTYKENEDEQGCESSHTRHAVSVPTAFRPRSAEASKDGLVKMRRSGQPWASSTCDNAAWADTLVGPPRNDTQVG